MAIPFLNNINLSNNELWNARLHNTGSANTNLGQIYFDTADNLAKYYSNGIDTWVSLKDYSFSNGTFVNLSTSGTTAKPIITANLSATGTADSSTFLRGDNTWATVVQENDFLTGLSFNTTDGILTATVQNQSDVTVDLDGRYALPSDIITYDLDSIQVGSDVAITLVGGGDVDTVTLVAGTNITLTDNGSKNITIDAANPDQTITLQGEVEGTGTTTIQTTVVDGVLDVANFNASAIVTAAEGIENNDNDTTLPTSASVKAYVDASVVGGLVYQGGYNAATNTPDLDATPIAGIKQGWTYTVTADGLFFTEQVRVGDVLIAEIDSPTTLADWTTVENNIDLASESQIGIGNVAAGSGVDVSYVSGTATISLTTVAARSGSIAVPTSTTYTYPNSITASSTNNVLIQLVDSNGETVYADVQRLSTTTFSVDYGVTEPTGVIALIQLIG